MELWIRSQDRLDLMKTTYICVVGCCIEVSGAERTLTLGNYKSEERALEVLDEIQKILKSSFIVNGFGEHVGQSNITIYEMPKE